MAITPNVPMVNEPNLYIQNLQLSYVSTTTMGVAAGQARDGTNTNDIILAASVVINAAVNGANGLDTGSLAANSFYAVFVAGDSTGYNDSCGLLSLSASAPSLPAGYDMFRRIGYVLTNGSSQILDFSQRGNGLSREMWYAAAIATDISAGASTTFAAVDASDSCPASAKDVFLKAVLTADAGATRTAAFKATSSSSAAGQAFVSSPASTVTTASVYCPCDADGDISYLVSNASAAIAISVAGYVDGL